MYRRFNFFIFSYLFTLPIYAQKVPLNEKLYIETNFHYGFVMPHHKFIAYLIDEHVKGYQVNIGLHTTGEKKWEQYYNCPNIGIGFYHSGLGNKEVFGEINAIYAYVERLFLKPYRKFNIGNRLAYGIGYINKKYDIQENPFDMAIGSHLNVYLNYSLEGTWRINPMLQFKFGVGLSHTSNGCMRLPNKGLNLMTSFIGFQYSFHSTPQVSPIKILDEKDEEKNQFVLILGAGSKQIDVNNNERVVPIALSAEYGYKIARTGWLCSSLNLYYDPSIKKEMEGDRDTATYWNNVRLSLNLGYELRLGKLGYVFQPGVYLKNDNPITGAISNRIGLRYYINSHFLAGVTIKAHWFAIADFVEFGVGYRWGK